MTKRIIRNRFISICLVLAMLVSCFPAGTAWAAMNESENGDLRVAAENFEYWYYNPKNVSGKWATTLEGWAVVGYNGTYFPLVVHPCRVPKEWIDSGRNDEGRKAIVDTNRYEGTYWKLENGLLDVNSGKETEEELPDYNLYLDEDTATLHLRDAYLEAMYCIILDNNVETIMPKAETDALTIELHGENKISAYHESSNISMGISFDPNDQRGDVTSDLILTEGDTTGDNSTEGVSTGESSLTMECGAVGNNPRAESYAIYLEHSDLTVDGIKLDVNVKAGEGQYKSRTAIKADNVTINKGSTVNVTLEEGGTAFDAQSVTIENGASLTVTMTKNCQLLASSASASTLSARSGGGLSIEKGGKLKIVVESGITDLTGVLAAGTDLSQVEFVVNGMLILPEGSDASELNGRITGSGNVVIRKTDGTGTSDGGGMYTINKSSNSLEKANGGYIDGDIEVSTGGSPVTDGTDGYTWTKQTYYINEDGELGKPVGEEEGGETEIDGESGSDTTGEDDSGGGTGSGEGETGGTSSELETIDVWTLTILRPNVLGDIIIEQVLPETFPAVPFKYEPYRHELDAEWLNEYRSSHQNEVEIHIIAKSSSEQCNIIGDVEVKYSFSYYNGNTLDNSPTKEIKINPAYEYLKVLGRLTFGDGDDDEINVDNITYKYGKVKIAGTLNGAGIQAFKAELLPTADLTLSEGISLTENSDNFQIITGMDLDEDVISQLPVILGILRGDDDWDSNKVSKYEDLLKKQFSAIGENSFIAQDGAQYKTTGASSSPVQVSIAVRSIIPLEICKEDERPQVIITLEGNNDPEDVDEDQDEDSDSEDGEGEDEKEGSDKTSPDGDGTDEPGDTPETPGEDTGGKDDVTPIATINLELTQDDVSKFIVFPDSSSLFPEGSEFIMEKSVQASNPSFATYTFSVKYPAIEGFEEMTHGYSPSSSGDLGYRLPSVNEGTDADGEGETAGENGGYSQPSNCVSDTLGKVTVDDSYQFQITTTDGTAPVVTVDNDNFRVEYVSQDGNDYYVKVCAVGGVNTTGDVYVNGTRVATLKVLYPYSGVSSDTTAPFTVRQGETYQFRLTSDTMPSMTAGSPSFVVEYAGSIGRDWFFKVRAVGEAGDGCGFYVNGAPFPVAIAHITAKES